MKTENTVRNTMVNGNGMKVTGITWPVGAILRFKGAEDGEIDLTNMTLPETVSIDNTEPLNANKVTAPDGSTFAVSTAWNFQNIKDALMSQPLSYDNIPNTGTIVTDAEGNRILTFPTTAAPHNYGVKG